MHDVAATIIAMSIHNPTPAIAKSPNEDATGAALAHCFSILSMNTDKF